jgi:hypothetical protein
VRLSRAVIALVASAAVVICILAGAGATALLYVLPGVLMFGVLLAGRYPGKATLARLRRSRPHPQHGAPLPALGMRRPAIVPPRGGLLLAFALAVRPPPCASAPS